MLYSLINNTIYASCCFRYVKDTILKANHNGKEYILFKFWLFPICQKRVTSEREVSNIFVIHSHSLYILKICTAKIHVNFVILCLFVRIFEFLSKIYCTCFEKY